VSGIGRLFLQRLDHHPLDHVIAHRPGRPRAVLVEEPVEALLDEAATPLAAVVRVTPSRCATSPLVILGAGQHDPGPQGQGLRGLTPIGQAFQHGPILRVEHQRLSRSSTFCHAHLHRVARLNVPARLEIPDPTIFLKNFWPGTLAEI
jgi:hypothetical protein